MKITIFAASSNKIDSKYFESAKAIAKILAKANCHIVYGGGDKGLMGQVADTILEEGGKITGIMPHFMREQKWFHKGVEDFVYVEDMPERKKRFLVGIDAILALPGGCGTLEELLEVITLKQLGQFLKPIIIFNQDGYYDPLLEMIQRCIDERFMRAEHSKIWTVISKADQLLDAIDNADDWDESVIKFAPV